jgi:stage II sporulation protein D
MDIRVLITAGDLVTTYHRTITVSSAAGLTIWPGDGCKAVTVKPGARVVFKATASGIRIEGVAVPANTGDITVAPLKAGASLSFSSAGFGGVAAKSHTYKGQLQIQWRGAGQLNCQLVCDLESYVQGVLQSEVPSSYQLEAMKAQAVLARTYGLRPRLQHRGLGDVCDSFLHCQAFYGVSKLTAMQQKAINETKNQILLYQGKPALALFSASAGGHTENYEFCFSDPQTNAFPPPAIPYLKGVPEGKLPAGFPSEAAMRKLHADPSPDTVDGGASQFRWNVIFSANDLEGHMHHVVENLMKDPQFQPFITKPPSGKFGHIDKFEIVSRGVAGTITELKVHTSEGVWSIKKELTIRSLFANPDKKLKRLRSARFFIDERRNNLGLLESITVSGLGSGHGVGLQQTGAQGLALRGQTYRQILDHYYRDTQVGNAVR